MSHYNSPNYWNVTFNLLFLIENYWLSSHKICTKKVNNDILRTRILYIYIYIYVVIIFLWHMTNYASMGPCKNSLIQVLIKLNWMIRWGNDSNRNILINQNSFGEESESKISIPIHGNNGERIMIHLKWNRMIDFHYEIFRTHLFFYRV